MKSFSTLISTFAVASCALARNCTPGLSYCGMTLLGVGKYQGQIDQALADNGIREVDNGRSVLFFCQGGNSGVIQFVKDYGVGLCVDAGAGNSDHCE